VDKPFTGMFMKKIVDFFLKAGRDFGKFSIVLAAIFLSGLSFGAILTGNSRAEILRKLDFLFFSDFEIKSVLTFVSNFILSLGASSIFLALIFLMSFSILGSIGIFITVLIKGIGLGMILGRLYVIYSFQEAIANFCILLPGAFFSVVSLILCASESLTFNLALTKKIRRIPCEDQNFSSVFLQYIKKIGISCFILIISALIDAGITTISFKLFR
jgi:hypothetical protein